MSDPISKNKYQILQPLLLAGMVIVGILLGRKIDESGTPETKVKVKNYTSVEKSNNAVEEANRFIEARYIDSVNLHELNDQAIKNVIHSLDPFSSYLPSDKNPDFTYTDFLHAYGFTAKNIKGNWLVSEIIPGSHAWLSTLEIGDRIINVNNQIPTHQTFTTWADTLLMVNVKSKKNMVSIALPRKDTREIKSIPIAEMLIGDIGYIKITHFGDNTYDEFITALDLLFAKKSVKNYIIDLRDNAGGYMEECSRVLNQLFTEKNILLATTEGRTVRKIEYRSDGRQLHDVGKIIVLINGKSASASEVFAGAIQDLERGKVIGSPSYGKGLVQEQYMLSNGAALRLSVARFYLPSGRTVDLTGKTINQTEKFYTLTRKPIKASNFIVPDILVSGANNNLTLDEHKNRIVDAVLLQKSSEPDTKSDPIKSIYTQIIASKKKWTTSEKNELQKTIKNLWGKTQKDNKSLINNHILPQAEIQSALKYLQS